MIKFFILLQLISLVYSYCGVNIQFIQFIGNDGYYEVTCNDLESYYICVNAEKMLNDYIDIIFKYTNNIQTYKYYNFNCNI